MNTPDYIKAWVQPTAQKPQGKKVWNIDLKAVWIPFFLATNTQGDTAIPSADLGHPIRLGYDKQSGEVRFSKTGRPIYHVSKGISEGVKMVRDNQIAGMIAFAGKVAESEPDGYALQVSLAERLGKPLADLDARELSKALEARAEAEANKVETVADTRELVAAS